MSAGTGLLGDVAELAGALEGRVLVGTAERAAYARDFSRMYTRRPLAVARCRSVEDIAATLRFATARDVPVTVRGGGLSGRGQSLGSGLALVPPSGRPLRWTGDDLVEVDAGAPWRSVLRALRERGRTVPVTTARLAATVGGTLSVGGYGIRSVRGGNQLDHVQRVRLTRANGETAWLSRARDHDHLSLALGTLGQLGVIDRVVLRTVPWSPVVLRRSTHASFARLAAWATREAASDAAPDALFAFADRADHRRGAIPAYVGVEAPERDGGRDADATLDGDITRWLAPFTGHRRCFTDLVLDGDGLASVAAWLDTVAPAARDLHGVYLLAAQGGSAFPFDGRHGAAPRHFGLGLYLLVPDGEPHRLAAAQALLSEALRRCLDEGGRPYLWGWHDLSADDLAALYGAPLRRLGELRASSDPRGILNRDAWIGREADAIRDGR